MLGRSWAVPRNQDKSPGAANTPTPHPALAWEGETRLPPNPPLPGTAVTANPSGGPGVGAAGVCHSETQKAVLVPSCGQAQACGVEGSGEGPCHPQPPPRLAIAGGGVLEGGGAVGSNSSFLTVTGLCPSGLCSLLPV